MSHYVFSDIHGDMKSWCAVKKQFGQPENMFIFLGDACDRGSSGYEIMKDMLSCSNLIYLKGNHEDMFVKAARSIQRWKAKEKLSTKEIQQVNLYKVNPDSDEANLCIFNGGAYTLNAWIQDGMPADVVNELNNLPLHHTYNKYDMCHAGVQWETWEKRENKADQEFEEECLWSRKHFNFDWENDRILIHGHTPTTSGMFRFITDTNHKRKHIPIQYAKGSKIDLDTRSIEVDFLWVYCLETEEFIKVRKN